MSTTDHNNEDLFLQLEKSARQLPPTELPHKNTAEELLALVLCEGSPAEYTEPLRWTNSAPFGYPDTPIPGRRLDGTITRVSLTQDEWHRLREYLFAKHNDPLPALAGGKHDPESYCRRIIHIYELEN